MMIQSYSTPASVSFLSSTILSRLWRSSDTSSKLQNLEQQSYSVQHAGLLFICFCFFVSLFLCFTVSLNLFLCFSIIFHTRCWSSVSASSPPPSHLWCSDTSVCRSTYSTTSPPFYLTRGLVGCTFDKIPWLVFKYKSKLPSNSNLATSLLLASKTRS